MAEKKSNPLKIMALVVGALAVVTAVSILLRPHDLIQWREDPRAAITEAEQSHKLLVVYLTATWCGPCQQMKHTTFADRDVESAMKDFVPLKLDIDHQKEAAAKYSFGDSIPQFVIVTSDGRVIRQAAGYMDSDEFVKWLKGKTI